MTTIDSEGAGTEPRLTEDQRELEQLNPLPLDQLCQENVTERGGDVYDERGQYARLQQVEGVIYAVPVNLIHRNPDQPRKYFTEEGAERLRAC